MRHGTAHDSRPRPDLWFDRGDNRPAGNPGGDFATGHYKGQRRRRVRDRIAYTGRFGSSRTPDALLCRQWSAA
ncbi:hypothetical protein Aca07nite_38290 [Actinoplanes capillaceus]|uniref:Uncharacterized protein n=1 Tax=Actinoplanes campanulatus TaxID=113559 RepID=A0ABQ3WJX9_9ACTN|nr:hypothetical protein [Actinoplanes capillaceus]GID46554.1 hypothetical protein Aca07nite_38290 [Actinoplanes capillaceus]